MADSTTTHYSFTKPQVGGSADTWGGKLNANWDTLDSDLYTISTQRLATASNLSDVPDKAAARTALELGTAATKDVGTSNGTVAAGDDNRITGAAQKSSNLSDLTNIPNARDTLQLKALALRDSVNNDYWSGAALTLTNGGTGATTASGARSALELGGAARLEVGTSSNTVAAGDDSRITGAAQKSANLNDLTDKPTARSNLGIGNVENKSSSTIRSELSKANVDAALGKTAARVNSGTGTNSGLISVGTGAPGGTPDDGQIYLQYTL